MKQIVVVLALLGLSHFLVAQQFEQAFFESEAKNGVQEFFHKSSKASFGGFTYVAGSSVDGDGNYDMLLTKYSGATEVWSVTWNGASNNDDYCSDVVTDTQGNIYICGTSLSSGVNYDAVVVKYNASGVLQWTQSYAGAAGLTDGFVSIERDANNNIYVCGGAQSVNEQTNFITIKYNSSGVQQWLNIYDNADLQDIAVKCVVGVNSVRVGGGSQINATTWRMATVSYTLSTGVQESVSLAGGDDEGIDQVRDLWTDGNNTYVVGGVMNNGQYDGKLIKLNSNLTVVWTASFNGNANMDDLFHSVKVDGSGNVVVCGKTTTTNEGTNYITRKYNSSGTLLWSATYHEEGDDEAMTVELDNLGHVLVSGSSYKVSNLDMLTIKYKSTDGSEVWKVRYNSGYNEDDIPSDIAFDESGNFYVLGNVGIDATNTKYAICKYSIKTVYCPVPTDGFSSAAGFIQNRGQVLNVDSTSNESIKFYSNKGQPGYYINDESISLLFSKLNSNGMDSLHRIDLKFNKGNGNAKTYGVQEHNHYYNYFLGYMSENAPRTPSYSLVYKPKIYNHTDLFISNETQATFWIVAQVGAPVGDYEIEFSGQDSIALTNSGGFCIYSSIGESFYDQPKAYSMNNATGSLTLLNWQPTLSLSGNKMSFSNFQSWTGTLVIKLGSGQLGGGDYPAIDNLEWSTYVGGSQGDQYYSVKVENELQYACGASESPIFLPFAGGFQDDNLGDRNPVWSRYKADHSLDYTTYYGGVASEGAAHDIQPYQGMTYVVGYTDCETLVTVDEIGADNDAFIGGQLDGFIAQFNSAGYPIWSRYVGGSGFQDRLNSIQVDELGIWIGGETGVDSDFPFEDAGGNHIYINTAQGSIDAVLMQFNHEHQLVWSTRIGGSGQDVAQQVFRDLNGKIWVTGYTSSNNFPTISSSGMASEDATLGGDWDDFVMRLFPDGSVEWSSYIGGSDTELFMPTGAQRLTVTPNQSVFFCGTTFSNDIPNLYTDATWLNDIHGGTTDGYVLKFNYNLMNVEWATFIGSTLSDAIFGCMTNEDNGVFFVGNTINDNLETVSSIANYYVQSPTPLASASLREDAIIFHINALNEIDWFTHWGGTSYFQGETPYSLFVGENKLYIVGATDQENLGFGENPGVPIPLVNFGGDSYFDATYNGEYEDAFICLFNIDLITSLNELTTNDFTENLLVFPSPTSELLTISYPFEREMEIEIYDVKGKVLYNNKIAQSDTTLTIPTQQLLN